jgi:hypothetical protein
MGPIIFYVCNARLEEAGVTCFSCTVYVNCTVQWPVQLTWTVYMNALFIW